MKRNQRYEKAVELRKQGHSYREIMAETGYSKASLHYHFKKLGMTGPIRKPKNWENLPNWEKGVYASQVKRTKRAQEQVLRWLDLFSKYEKKFPDKFWAAIMLYVAEGSKQGLISLANQDWRIIKFFRDVFNDIEENVEFGYRIIIHEVRSQDKDRILNFWVHHLNIQVSQIQLQWKRNEISKRKDKSNLDYVGMMNLKIRKSTNLNRAIHKVAEKMLGERFND